MCMPGTASPNMDRAEYEESLKVFWDFGNVLRGKDVRKVSVKPIFVMQKISRRWEWMWKPFLK